MKKPLLTLLLCSFSLVAQEDVVFRGTPTVRAFATVEQNDRQTLDAPTALKNECVIVQRGKKYLWASRNYAPLTRVDSAQYTYFLHNGGAGYVKVFIGARDAKAAADYIENINQGFEVITYWGRANTVVTAEPAK